MKIVFPEYYDEFSEFEHEAKGYLCGVEVLTISGVKTFDFYDTDRLMQEINDNLSCDSNYYYINNFIIVSKVNRKNIINALMDFIN